MKRVAITTMGCKVNAYDSAHIRGSLQDGVEMVPFSDEADVYVINTCTVTNNSDSEARKLIRRSKRRNPDAVTIVTGCYATVAAKELSEVEGVDYVFGNADKAEVSKAILAGPQRQGDAPILQVSDINAVDEVRHVDAAMFEGHTRAYLKVQEGCMYRCTYCIIPYSRGGSSRSVPLAQCVTQARELAAAGYRELVLTGVHIGSWGHEYDLILADLVEALTEVDGIERIRISSIDSPELHPRLVELVAHHPKVATHVHVCLQSGSDGVLQRMGRVYDAASYREAVSHLVLQNPDICVGTDIIVGFPGETDEEFSETVALLEDTPIHHYHVFTFSPRRGTPAADMPGIVHGDVMRARSRTLRDMGGRRKAQWAARFEGRRMEALFEQTRSEGTKGRARNYFEIRVPDDVPAGQIRHVDVLSVDRHGQGHGRLVTV